MLKTLPYILTISESEYDRYLWRRVEFPSASVVPSGIVDSTDGVAFLGWPNSFLISLLQPPMLPNIQSISAQLTFVRKRNVRRDEDWIDKSGLAIYLPEKVLDIQSPEIDGGIKVFIGYNGRISIENRDRDLLDQYYQSRTTGQLQRADCYAFELVDRGWHVKLVAWIRRCDDDALYGRTEITLETPILRSRQLRNVIVSKRGDMGVDLLLQNLKHNSASLHSSITALMLLLIIRLFA
uniref:Menorin C-terminal domain-containing protein n=1 Tax=Parascaris univalens TaxID=6257 RepID=A0A915BK54_PARUN